MKAQELNGTHIGLRVAVQNSEVAIVGTLFSIYHWKGSVRVTLIPDMAVRVDPDSEVELIDEPAGD